MLQANNISLYAGEKNLLKDINFSCEAGQFIALCGPNGAGKSSLLKVLSGDMQAQNGEVFYQHNSIKNLSALDLAQIRAVMPQNMQVSFNLSTQAVLEMGLMFCQSEAEKQNILAQMAKLLDIEHLLHSAFNALSGGEQQRVQLARVIAQLQQRACTGERYLLLDECTSAMDMAMMHKAFTILQTIKKQDIGIIAVVHDLNLASLYADKMVILKEGKEYATGSPQKVIKKDIINGVFDASVEIIQHPKYQQPVILQNRL